MRIAVIGIDLGKNSCSLAALDDKGAVVKRRRLRPDSIPSFTRDIAPCVVAMEACCGAHHLGRLLAAQGHQVRLMSPEYVRPYVKAQKNDERDAEAIAEAATRPTMRFVELKAEAQLDMQTLHRARDRLVGERTALINQLRAILLERGITIPQGRRKLQRQLAAMIDQAGGMAVSPRLQVLVEDMRAQWAELDRRIGAFDDEMVQSARSDEAARRLTSIPGIGALNATALIAAIGNAEAFSRARDLAAWLGLVPRQVTTGGRPRPGRDHQARQQLSAPAADPRCARGPTRLGGQHDPAGHVAARADEPDPQERRRGGAGQQARAHRLGGAPAGRAVPTRHRGRGVTRSARGARRRRTAVEICGR
jgi:transposase